MTAGKCLCCVPFLWHVTSACQSCMQSRTPNPKCATELLKIVCRFVDPTNDVTGLSRYRKALTILFDPDRSEVKLKQIRVSGSAMIEADWTLGGYLKLPWQPYIDTINGHTVSSQHLLLCIPSVAADNHHHDKHQHHNRP